jgi:hypothetical protein
MSRYLVPAAIGLALGVVGFWLVAGFLAVGPADSDHAPGAGKFESWSGPKANYLHIYLTVDELAGCPTAIRVFPDDGAAQISRENQPKKVLWKVQGDGPEDEWAIEVKSGADHFPGRKEIKRKQGQDTWWSKKPVAAGQDPELDWEWKYKVTVARPDCAQILLDPPVYIRKK